MINKYHFVIKMLAMAVFIFGSSKVYALNFTPSEFEWQTWGEKCQARYVVSGRGSKSIFVHRVAKSVVNQWNKKVGRTAWYMLHHYCAGIIYERRGKIREGIKEYEYTIATVPPNYDFHADISARMARAHYKLKNTEKALHYAQKAIDAKPKMPHGYVAKAFIERSEGKLDAAIKTLIEGNSNTYKKDSEINYHLGLAYMKRERYQDAMVYAKAAYKLGYPLPGLKDQLTRVGVWTDD